MASSGKGTTLMSRAEIQDALSGACYSRFADGPASITLRGPDGQEEEFTLQKAGPSQLIIRRNSDGKQYSLDFYVHAWHLPVSRLHSYPRDIPEGYNSG
jgi:hypothetical protein